MYSFSYLEAVCCSTSSSNCCFLTCIQISQEASGLVFPSVVTLNVNGLNIPTKRHRLAERLQKQDPYICCVQETHFRPQDTYRLKVRRWKNIFHANRKKKKAGVAILISGKIDMIKESIQEEDITIVNTYAPNIGAPQYIRHI